MSHTLAEIATKLDELADIIFQLAGGVAKNADTKDIGAQLYDENGKPIDLRDWARDIRAHIREQD